MAEYDKTAATERQNARTKELTDRLEAGMKELYDSDKYKDYLKTMAQFHYYSSRNIMLIRLQKPDATRVASYNLWKEKFNRQVRKGEAGLYIYAPIGDKKPETKLMEKLDPETGAPLLDENGKVIMEEMTALARGPRFKLVPVFDIKQTQGDPLPELVENLTGNVAHYDAFIDALKSVSPLSIEFEPLHPDEDGYVRFGEKIGIREGMSEAQTVSAVIHEITHSRLHDKNADADNSEPKSKRVKEVEAESIAFVVAAHYGIETSPNSFGYLAEYGSRDMSELRASIDTIRKEANSLITAIDVHFGAICKERGIDLAANGPEQTESRPEQDPALPTDTQAGNTAAINADVGKTDPTDTKQTQKSSLPQQNYQKLAEMFPQVVSGEYFYQRLEAGSAMMPLSLEWIGDKQLSIMHTYTQNGDLMYDPMIVLDVDRGAKTATAAEFQQSNPPLYQRIDEDGIGHSIDGNGNERTINSLRGQLDHFSSQWLNNIGNQNYLPVNAVLNDAEYADPCVYYNDEQKPYSLAFVYSADGTTIMNNLDRDDAGNMATVAHVDSFRNATFFEENLPKDVITTIENVKLTHEKTEQEKHAAKVETPDDAKSEHQLCLSEPMPDPAISIRERNDYGYNYEGMLPLTTERAVELFNNDHSIYLLYPDNTEAMAFDTDEIITFGNDGIFGIEKADWERSPEYAAMSASAKNAEAVRESEPIHGKSDAFAIYQLRRGDETWDYRFESIERLEERGLAVDRGNYALAYTAPLPAAETLEGIYQQFNTDHPKDFTGHSLSVSDIVVIQRDGEVSSHYVDSFGFTELPAFLGVERQNDNSVHNEPAATDKSASYHNEWMPQPEMPKRDEPIYMHPIDHAMQNGEIGDYHRSRELNAECGRAIDKAIADSSYELYRYDLKSAVNSVIDEYGADRAAWVLASNINHNNWDGRLSNENKAWAKGYATGEPDVHLLTHLSVLDGYANRFREAADRKPSLIDTLSKNEQKSRVQEINPDIGKDKSKKSDREEL